MFIFRNTDVQTKVKRDKKMILIRAGTYRYVRMSIMVYQNITIIEL
jgi:hypothetical protein